MGKNLKDYIQYYIGCRCLNTWFTPEHEMYDNDWRLTGYLFESRYEKPYYLSSNETYTWTDSIKPILRRLEDITDAEIKQMINYEQMNVLYRNLNYKKHPTGINIEYDIEVDDGSIYPQFHNISLLSHTPKQFHYLLKQGFDLFSLIPDGLAIDEKILTK